MKTHDSLSRTQAEATGLPDASYDLAALTFIVHELPSSATKAIAEEVRGWRKEIDSRIKG